MRKIFVITLFAAICTVQPVFAAETYNPECLWCPAGSAASTFPNGTNNTSGGSGSTNNTSGSSSLSVTTYGANNARTTSMTVSGFFTGAIGTVTPGVLYGTNANNLSQLRLADSQTGANGFFSVTLTGLTPATLYYMQAVVYSANGTSYGSIKSLPTQGAIVESKQTQSTTTQIGASESTASAIKNTAVNNFNKYVAYDTPAGAKTGNEFLTIETGDSVACPQDKTTYIVRYANATRSAMSGVLLSVSIPTGVSIKNTSAGTYNETSRTVLVQIGTLSPGETGIVYIAGVLTNDAIEGKLLTPRVDLSYTIGGTQQVQTVYGQQSTQGCTKSFDLAGLAFGSGNFFPTSFLGWILLILVIFAIVFVIRFIARKQKAGHGDGHGHGH